jgi:NADPH:quinone reductase-like Zn-dependent oxidoreductase
MEAIVYRAYGAPLDVLHVEDVEQPTPGDDDVLVRVRAASVNPMDVHLMGDVYLMRLMTGLRKPKPTVPGVDFAGVVDAVGKNVTRFKPGDAVFGVGRGAFAEYVCTTESRLAAKPVNISFEQAAALPVAGLTALQGICDKGKVQTGQHVLINGAAGGVGTFAVQVAKSVGAHVTGVCSTRGMDLVRSLGADQVIDYTTSDATRSDARYDVVLDTAGNHPLSAWHRVMTAKGIFVPVGVRPAGRGLGPLPYLLKLLVWSRFVSQRVAFFTARANSEELMRLAGLVEAGSIVPVVDRCYALRDAGEAIRHLKQGHPRGKVVIAIDG